MKEKLLLVVAASALVLGACGSDDSSKASVSTLTVERVWVEPTAEGSDTSNVYFRVASPVDDVLLTAAVSSFVAADAEVHQVLERDGEKEDDIEYVGVPAKTWVDFEPGGHYVKLVGLAEPLAVGQTVEVTLSFDSGNVQTIDASVQESAPK